MKQYVSRRRRCWTLPVQMDPVFHLSVDIDPTYSNERDFDRVADTLVISTSTHSTPRKSETNEGQGQRRVQTWRQFKHSLVSRKGKGKHIESGKPGASANYANFMSVEDYDYDDDRIEPADACKAHNDPADLEVTTGKRLWTMIMMMKTTLFLRRLLWMTLLFSRRTGCDCSSYRHVGQS